MRANLVASAEQRRWTSLWHRLNQSQAATLADWPLRPGQKWLDYVNQPETEAELKALRRSAHCGTPFGETTWQQATAKRLGLESSFRPPGRPQRLSAPSVTGPKVTQIDTNENRPHFRSTAAAATLSGRRNRWTVLWLLCRSLLY